MSGLAQVLAQQGQRVSGSDMQSSAIIERLGRRGIEVNIGHDDANIPWDTDIVVISAAVKQDNPELQSARRRNLPVYKYAQMLGQLSRDISTLAVSGTHGKSTTSGWLAYMLQRAGMEPSYVIGADVEQLGSGSGAGMGEHLVVEACEYDRSFLSLHPAAAAILNIEADHLDYYKDIDDIIDAFTNFARQVVPAAGGLLVLNAQDDNSMKLYRTLKNECGCNAQLPQCETFAVERELAGQVSIGPFVNRHTVDGQEVGKTDNDKKQADWQAVNVKLDNGNGCFELVYKGQCLGKVSLSLPGMHNVANALAAAALARWAGLGDEDICAGLEKFVGVGRRISYKGQVAGVVVLDDYAHHPTEIKTTLAAIQGRYKPARLWCVFQPHQHSRTRFMLSEFATSFAQADVVLLPDIYFVRDSAQLKREVNAAELAELINKNGGQAEYLGDFETITEKLCRQTQPGDVVVVMGAGDIWKLADEFIRRLGTNS